jgi:hypothetical protein
MRGQAFKDQLTIIVPLKGRHSRGARYSIIADGARVWETRSALLFQNLGFEAIQASLEAN